MINFDINVDLITTITIIRPIITVMTTIVGDFSPILVASILFPKTLITVNEKIILYGVIVVTNFCLIVVIVSMGNVHF